MSGEQTIDVVVKAIEQVTPLIKHFKLAPVGVIKKLFNSRRNHGPAPRYRLVRVGKKTNG